MALCRRFTALAILGSVALSCAHRSGHGAPAEEAALRVDSSQYTVRLVGLMYEATIGFVFTNHTGGIVSESYCRTPTPPILEKRLDDGRWLLAYSQILLMCQSIPPFRLAPGESYRGTLYMAAAKPGANIVPRFEPDSVPGIYRLRWVLRSGPDPDNRSRPTVEAISPSFRFVGP
jgi:hypothetical protein